MQKSSLLTVAISLALIKQAYATEQQMVVTASKQSEYAASSQNVASHSVSGSQLEDANITSSQELNRILPGLYIGKSDSFINPMVSVRGTSTGQDFYNTPVTLYIDGVPQPTVAFMQPLADVESVQFLKGPQGTLYGKSAEGGIINIVTRRPDSDSHGYISGGYASRNGYNGKFALSGAISDGLLYGSISGLRQVEKGRMTNPANGHKNLGGQEDNQGAFRLRLAPDSQPWEVNAAYTLQCTNSSQGLSLHPLAYNPWDNQGVVYGNAPDPEMHRCMQMQSLTGQYNTDRWLFSTITSWDQIKVTQTYPTPFDFDPARRTLRYMGDRWLENTQELRMTTQGENNTVDILAGLYRHDTRWYKYNQWLSYNKIPVAAKTYSFVQMSTMAAYTDLTWHISQKLDIGAGLRLSHDTAKTVLTTSVSRQADTKNNNVSGQLSAGYQITRLNRIYARIAQGYKPVGYDYGANPATTEITPYKPEKMISYEIGNKYQRGNLAIQGAIFYTQTHDLLNYKDVGNGPGNLTYALKNLGDANTVGAELSGVWHFISGWKIGANGTLLNSRFTHDANNTSYAGRRVPSVPKYNAGIYLDGNITTTFGTITPYIGFNMVGGYTFGDYDYTQRAYSTTDLRIAWQATNRITLSAYVNNLFDKRFFTFADTRYIPFDYGYANIGRTAGVDVKIDLF